jgi:predicted transcriptional regulator of viral defense system
MCVSLATYLFLAIVTHMPPSPSTPRAVALVGRNDIATAGDLRRKGIHHEQVRRQVEAGHLVRVARGLYSSPSADLGEHASLALAAKAVPHGVICLLSALRFHGIGTQLPAETWVAVCRGDAIPRALPPGIRIIRVSAPAFEDGQKAVLVQRIRARVYDPAKTVADCFKFRSVVGLEVALEALREALRLKLATRDAIWRHAQVCRVARVLQPYLEATA